MRTTIRSICAAIALPVAVGVLLAADAGPTTAPAPVVPAAPARFELVHRVGEAEPTRDDNARPVYRAAFDGQGSVLMTATGRAVHLWAVPKMEPVIPPISPPGGVAAADLSADGTTVLVARRDGWLEARDVVNKAVVWRHRGAAAILSARFTPPTGRNVLVVEKGDPTVRLLDARTGRVALTIPDDRSKAVASALVTRDGERIVTDGELGPTRVWSAAGRPIATLTGGNLLIDVDAKGELVAQAKADTVVVSDASTGAKVSETEWTTRDDTQPAHVQALAFSPDGRSVAAALDDNGVRLYDVRTGLPAAVRFDAEGVASIRFSPDGRQLVAAGVRGATVFDAGSGRRLVVMDKTIAGQPAPVAVTVSSDGRFFAVNFGGPVELWERR